MLIDVCDDEQATVTASGDIRRIGQTNTLRGRRLEELAGGGFRTDQRKERAGERGSRAPQDRPRSR